MNQSNFEVLTESQRLAYLQAMDVPVWIPRLQEEDNLEALSDNLPSETHSDEAGIMAVQAEVANNILAMTVKKADEQVDDKQVMDEQLQSSNDTVNNDLAKGREKSNTQFLKMVNWRSASEAKKRLLVICRHQIDQPAQSFARPGGPSQFMKDYLQTIDECITLSSSEWKGSDIQVKLAHLTEAGLTNDNQPMDEKLLEIRPDIILLLGDESVRYLFKSESSVAELRGKIQHFQDYQLLVSYHPYSLITNPELKKLALEDLALLSKTLQSET